MKSTLFLLFFFFTVTGFTQVNELSQEEERIGTIIMALPEVKAIDGIYDTISNRYQKVKLLITPPEDALTYYKVEAGFQGTNRFQPHFYFYVDTDANQIMIEDLDRGDRVSLETWRERKRNPSQEFEIEDVEFK